MNYTGCKLLCSLLLLHIASFIIAQEAPKFPAPNDREIEEIYAKHQYDWIAIYKEGIALARKGNDFFAIDHTGEKQFDFNYQEKILRLKDDLAPVKSAGLYGFIDRHGKEITPMQFNYLNYLGYGLAGCDLNGKTGLYEIATQQFYEINGFIRGVLPNNQIVVENDYQKMGVVNWKNEVLVPFDYQHIAILSEDYLRVKKNIFNGVINLQGQLLIPPVYKYVEYVGQDNFIVSKDGKEGLVNKQHQFLLALNYYDLHPVGNCLVAKRDGQYGVYDKSGKALIPVAYESYDFYSRTAIFLTKGEEHIVFDTEHLKIIPASEIDNLNLGGTVVQEIRTVSENKTLDGKTYKIVAQKWGLRLISIDDKRAVLDRQEKLIIPLDKYDDIKISAHGIIVGKDDPNAFYIHALYDFNGKELLPFEYVIMSATESGIFCRKKTEVLGDTEGFYVFKKGMVIPTEHCLLSEIENGYFLGSENCTDYFFFNLSDPSKKDTIRPAQYYPNTDVAKIEKDGKFGLFYATSEAFTGFYYDSVATFDGYFLVGNDGKFGLIGGYQGFPVLELRYDDITEVNEEVLMARLNNKMGLFHMDGRTIYRCVLDEINFSDSSDYITVKSNNLYAVLNKNYRDVFYPKYKSVKVSQEKIILVQNEKWGIVDEFGKSITELKYDALSFEIPGMVRAQINNKLGILNSEAVPVLPIIFDQIRLMESSEQTGQVWKVQIGDYNFTTDLSGQCVDDCPSIDILTGWGMK